MEIDQPELTDTKIRENFDKIFNESLGGFDKDLVDLCISYLQVKNTNLNITLTFIRAIKNSLENALIVPRRDANSYAIENFIQFIVHLSTRFIIDSHSVDCAYGIIPFANIINYLVDNHRANCDTVRYRICQILNELLQCMSTKGVRIDSYELVAKIKSCMRERMRDVNIDVQLEAVGALEFLQDTRDAHCDAHKDLLNLLAKTSIALKVRLKILSVLKLTKRSFEAIRELFLNCSDGDELRDEMCRILICKIPFRYYDAMLVRAFFVCLAESDDEELVRVLMQKMRSALGSEDPVKIFDYLQVNLWSEQLLARVSKRFSALFIGLDGKMHDEELVRGVKWLYVLKDLNLGYAEMSHYRFILDFFYAKNEGLDYGAYGEDDEDFCISASLRAQNLYIQLNFYLEKLRESEKVASDENKFVLGQFMHLFTYFGPNYKELACDALLNHVLESPCYDEALFTKIFDHLRSHETMISSQEFIENLIEQLIKLEATHLSCVKLLFVLCELLSDENTRDMNYSIEDILEKFVLPCIGSEQPLVRRLATRALGLCCLFSADIALNYVILFTKMIDLDENSVVIEALQALFNILYLTTVDNDEGFEDDEPHFFRTLVKKLKTFLDSEDEAIKLICCEGFAKLFICARLENLEILSKMIFILLDANKNKKHQLVACLSKFFKLFIKHNNESGDLFENLVIPIMDIASNLKGEQKVDHKELAKFFAWLVYSCKDATQLVTKILKNLLNKIAIELECRNFERADEDLKFIIQFYDDKFLLNRNSDASQKLMDLYQRVMILLRNLKCSSQMNDFKEFGEYVKRNITKANASSEKKKSKTPTKRKIKFQPVVEAKQKKKT